ncbi:MAG: hypothetical protein EOO67_02030, partial [Microbacterium sp.]
MTTTTIGTLSDRLCARWVPLTETDVDRRVELRREHGIDFDAAGGKVWESDDFVYLPLTVERRLDGAVVRDRMTFAISDELLATILPAVPYPLFDKAVARMRRTPDLAATAHGIAYALF